MVYTAHHPPTPDREDLRARIPGWGVDLDPRDRPSVPRERFDPDATGAHWDLPPQQPERVPRERSIEHSRLTPVFGTSAPLHGPSGALRRLAYRRFSEGRAAHWLILLGADRVDSTLAHLASFATLHPDNPVTQTGIRAELTHGGLASRTGTTRVDTRHAWMDPIIVGGPWALGAVVVTRAVRTLARRR